MTDEIIIPGQELSKKEKYQSLLPQIQALIEPESDIVANLANVVAALKYGMDFFWIGIYQVIEDQLVLRPFQGPVACSRIGFGKGVCGAACQRKETIIVPDVDQFPGHIACNSLSRSEIVVPGFDKNKNVIFVLDVDSDRLNNFDHEDQLYLEQVVHMIENKF